MLFQHSLQSCVNIVDEVTGQIADKPTCGLVNSKKWDEWSLGAP